MGKLLSLLLLLIFMLVTFNVEAKKKRKKRHLKQTEIKCNHNISKYKLKENKRYKTSNRGTKLGSF